MSLHLTGAGDEEPERFKTITVFLPEYIVRQIPHYVLKLDAELAKPDCNLNALITIEDDYTHKQLICNYAIQLLASGFLPDLSGDEFACEATLQNLISLYEFSVQLSAEALELAVTKHIDSFRGLTLSVFLNFARAY